MEVSPILSWFYVQTGSKGRLVRIDVDRLIYLESAKNYLHFITETGRHMTYLTLTEMLERLPGHFLRVHKAFVINLEKIAGLEANTLIATNGDHVPVGPNYRKELMQQLEVRIIRSHRQEGDSSLRLANEDISTATK